MEREQLNFEKEEAANIVQNDHEDFEVIIDDIVDTTRWSILKNCVVKRKSDNKFFSSNYSVGATESQDQYPYDHDEPIFHEVFAVKKTIVVYE